MLKSYLKKIFKIANQGDAREESYYATLEELFKKIAQSFGKVEIGDVRSERYISYLAHCLRGSAGFRPGTCCK